MQRQNTLLIFLNILFLDFFFDLSLQVRVEWVLLQLLQALQLLLLLSHSRLLPCHDQLHQVFDVIRLQGLHQLRVVHELAWVLKEHLLNSHGLLDERVADGCLPEDHDDVVVIDFVFGERVVIFQILVVESQDLLVEGYSEFHFHECFHVLDRVVLLHLELGQLICGRVDD